MLNSLDFIDMLKKIMKIVVYEEERQTTKMAYRLAFLFSYKTSPFTGMTLVSISS